MIKNHPKNKYFKQNEEIPTHWMHCSPVKRIINPVLRKLQFWTRFPYVIASVVEWEEGIDERIPHFQKYIFTPVRYYKTTEEWKQQFDVRTP